MPNKNKRVIETKEMGKDILKDDRRFQGQRQRTSSHGKQHEHPGICMSSPAPKPKGTTHTGSAGCLHAQWLLQEKNSEIRRLGSFIVGKKHTCPSLLRNDNLFQDCWLHQIP